MRSCLIAMVLSACGSTPATVSTPPATAQEVAIPRLVHADFTVVPAELGDEGVLARIPHRVRIRRFGDAWLADDGTPAKKKTYPKNDRGTDVLLPAIGETDSKIRVVFHDDEARLAIWIPKRDTWRVIGAPIELADPAHRTLGIAVVRGAPVELAEPRERGWRNVTVRDDGIELSGAVPDAVLTNVWLADRDAKVSLDPGVANSWNPPSDNRPKVRLVKQAAIHAGPSASSPVIASTLEEITAWIAGPHGDFTAVEIPRPYATVKGYVAAAQLADTSDDFGMHGSGSGHGFGMSHADKIDVQVGACLYDKVDGEVVGVQTEASTRLGAAKWAPGWAQVHVGTSWMVASLFVKNVGTDPTQPAVWESCTQPSHP